jgi:hypothetical protein
MLIDFAISRGRHTRWFKYDRDYLCVNKSQFVPVIFEPPCMIKKQAEKILKYKDLTIEIQRMRNVNTDVITVIIWATGTVSKPFRKYLTNTPGKHKIKKPQKTSILGTAHILRNVLM